MTENITRQDLIEFLHEHLSAKDFNRVYHLACANKKARLLLRMTQKIEDIEHLIVDISEDNIFFRFVPDSIACKSFSELTNADLIPDTVVFIDK
jgi:hypothetical protein